MKKRFSCGAFVMQEVLIHIILIGIIFLVFFISINQKMGNVGVQQQILEKDLALMIDSAKPGMSFSISKEMKGGIVNRVRIEGGKILVDYRGFVSLKGYPYFTRYSVEISENDNKFVVRVKDE